MDLSNRDAKGGLGSKGYSHGEGNAVSSGAMAVPPRGATQLLQLMLQMTGSSGLSKGLTVLHCVVYLQTLVRLNVFCPIAKMDSPLQRKFWLKEFRDVLGVRHTSNEIQYRITYYHSALVLTQLKQ